MTDDDLIMGGPDDPWIAGDLRACPFCGAAAGYVHGLNTTIGLEVLWYVIW